MAHSERVAGPFDLEDLAEGGVAPLASVAAILLAGGDGLSSRKMTEAGLSTITMTSPPELPLLQRARFRHGTSARPARAALAFPPAGAVSPASMTLC